MLCGEGNGRFQKLLKDYIAEVAQTKVPELLQPGQPKTFPLAMHVQFLAGAILSLVAWWLENDRPYTPYQMAQYIMLYHSALLHHF